MSTYIEFEASFVGGAGDSRDLVAHNLVEQHEGMVLGAGTFLATRQRDLQIRVPVIHLQSLKEALRKAGLTVEETH